MDKQNNKRGEKPKLRKEDIGLPVNFVHVHHVGFGQEKSMSMSACTSPTDYTGERPFFNQKNYRNSDSSVGGSANVKTHAEKENRLSDVQRYDCLSDLASKRNSFGSKLEKQKQGKPSLSGSLLNLNLFSFSKNSSSSTSKAPRSKSNQEIQKSKRLSLGLVFTDSFLPNKLSNPPPVPLTPPEEQTIGLTRNSNRRRSSSFNGQHDLKTFSSSMKPNPPSLTLGREQMTKKPKMIGLSLSSPPISPSYDELPPPPPFDDMTFTTNPNPDVSVPPESPSYEELPPPPPMTGMASRKASFFNPSDTTISLPPPPSPPSTIMRGKISDIPAMPQRNAPSPLPSPPSTPPPLPTSPPPKIISTAKKVNGRGKLIRVNAPTLPPLSVPLVRPKNQSPGTPSTWPLEPGVKLYQDTQDSSINSANRRIEYDKLQQETDKVLEKIRQVCRNKNSVSPSDIESLSQLLQSGLSLQDWPKMMDYLLSTSGDGSRKGENPKIAQIYSHLIQNTLDLWLQLQGENANPEKIVVALARTRNKTGYGHGESATRL